MTSACYHFPVQSGANAQELAALRDVIRCVKQYKLEADYPLDPLQKRLTQLEKSKPDKKRSVESVKHQQYNKKPRANGGNFGFRAPTSVVAPTPTPAPVFGERTVYPVISERYPHAPPSSYDYQTPSQSTYASQQAYDQRSYYYPQDERVTASYGSYMGSGMQPAHQQYM
ncbi:hypothetical protein U1Q18_042428 [Sarracenia purpurea var. burkii]